MALNPDNPYVQQGDRGQHLVSALLQRRGWHVVPSYDYSGKDGGKAPRMQGALRSYVIPDLDTARKGIRFWAEVKTKTIPYIWRTKPLPPEHGIERRLWHDYQAVQRETGDTVYLFVVERLSGTILCETIDRLKPYVHLPTSQNGYSEPMIYWPRSAMRHFGTFDTSFFSVHLGEARIG